MELDHVPRGSKRRVEHLSLIVFPRPNLAVEALLPSSKNLNASLNQMDLMETGSVSPLLGGDRIFNSSNSDNANNSNTMIEALQGDDVALEVGETQPRQEPC